MEDGIEHWFRGGFALRTFLGYGWACSANLCGIGPKPGVAFPYLGLGLGYAF